MKRNLKYSLLMRCKTLAVLAVYLFVSLSFIFFLGNLVPGATSKTTAKVSIENTHSHSDVQRQDKATLKSNDRLTWHSLPAVVLYLHLTFGNQNFYQFTAYKNYSRTACNYRFSYLCLRSLRI